VDGDFFGLLGLAHPVAMLLLMLIIFLHSFKGRSRGRNSWSDSLTGFTGNMLDDATVFCTGEELSANSINLRCFPRTLSTASSCSSTILCIAQSDSAVGQTPTFFRRICSFSMLKGAFVELNPDRFCPGDKLGGLLSCPDLIWLLDSALAASEQNLMHLLVGLTSTQKGRESLMVQSIHKIVVLFFLLLNCPLLSEPLRCFR
jgi:hypothetical protein